jgi:hypothetical protein
MEWESIDNFHLRTKVFGGWLVKAYEHVEHGTYVSEQGYFAREQSQEMTVSMTFIPDTNHEWVINN